MRLTTSTDKFIVFLTEDATRLLIFLNTSASSHPYPHTPLDSMNNILKTHYLIYHNHNYWCVNVC